jgi:hypothetical protein
MSQPMAASSSTVACSTVTSTGRREPAGVTYRRRRVHTASRTAIHNASLAGEATANVEHLANTCATPTPSLSTPCAPCLEPPIVPSIE